MQRTRSIGSWSVGIVITLFVAGCVTKDGHSATDPPVSQGVGAGKQDDMLQDWAEAQEEPNVEGASVDDISPGEIPTPADLDAALLFMGGLVLIEAAEKGDLKGVQEEVARGTNPNAKDGFGNTALMAAAAKGHAEVVRSLLEAGADPSLKNTNGKSAAQLAQDAGFEEIRALLDS